ncbi:MAG: SDR family oxidoreductase [Candidatus Rokubacteria bacterium]|nr:SDR family oxidoreductase [Candidatus Rokubacteria bacterium]
MLLPIMPSESERTGNKRVRALVTGGAIRLGRAIALALAEAGMDVAIGYHRSSSEARRTVADLERRGVRAVAIRADLTRPGAAARLVERAATALGGLEVLVNSAAAFRRTPFGSITSDQYDEFLALNLRAPLFCVQAAVELMRRDGGHVVNVGDAAADRPLPGYIPYAVSKAGLVALTRNLAVALRSRRVAVNCVAPGPVLRPRGFPRDRWHTLTRNRTVSLGDVAAAVVFFATCPRSITGQTVAIDLERPTDFMGGLPMPPKPPQRSTGPG